MDINSMSLDEIIRHQKLQRNQNAARPKPPGGRGGGHANASGHQWPSTNRGQRPANQVRDARDVIYTKIRSKMTDAREKLVQKNRHIDARVKLRNRAYEAQRRAALNGAGGSGGGGRRHSHANSNRGGHHHRTNRHYMDLDAVHESNGDRLYTTSSGGQKRSSRSTYMDLDAVHESNGDRHYSTSSGGQQRSSRSTYMDLDAVHEPDDDLLYTPTRRQPLSLLDIPPTPLSRTVSNEMWSDMPPLPRFRSGLGGSSDTPLSPLRPVSLVDLPWSDPFEKYERLPRPQLFNQPDAALMVPYEPTPRQPRGILRKSSPPPPSSDGAKDYATNIKARLERAPNAAESMGIFAKMSDPFKYKPAAQSKPATVTSAVVYRGSSAAPPPPPKAGYRIVVSNLHPKVVHEDIEELFADIGDLIETRLVRPGIAEVIYHTLQDAEKAVEVYHNRQLDGQPMNCLLVNPRYTSTQQPPIFHTF
ncbi:uncharacterized protein LOC131290512 [Anopheles ziemanni]|uniref:uncharacterized protein LOC131269791 n=1 Tax=Anopheles coustani TaxID=139045 RepID=UPI002657E41F|nr:uncharacterized protein LOC131269791 [Anopheles coustani]XP_058175647.1 uncharacterized protein LOC131290512 [Anopheles ziemanni]